MLVSRTEAAVVTLLPEAGVPRPSLVDGRAILEPASPIVWFTFPGEAHDVGRFHTADGAFTGYYANVLTPVEGIGGTEWSTTDLFLDVWLPADGGEPRVLDVDELDEALANGWIDAATAAGALAEADRIVAEARAGRFPPPVVGEWTLERARAAVGA